MIQQGMLIIFMKKILKLDHKGFKMGFGQALARVLKAEGGYVNHPGDNGGETFKGIARNFYPKWSGWIIVDSYADKEEAVIDTKLQKLVEDFYFNFYWYKLKCSDMHNEFIAEMLFNFAINMGKKQVVKKLQRILNVKADGIIGMHTLAALNSREPQAFVHHFILEIVEFYAQISKKGNNHLFFRGWINRAMNVYYDAERYFK